MERARPKLHTSDMRIIAAALAVLLSACSTEPATDGGEGTIAVPRGERCDEMQSCGRDNCEAEARAVTICAFAPEGCDEIESRRAALIECMEAAECITVDTCDVDAWASDAEAVCDDPSEEEAFALAMAAMFADDEDAAVTECMSLE